MIINGSGSKAIEISMWLVKEYGLRPIVDYRWRMIAQSNNTKIKFEFKDTNIETLVLLRFLK